MIIVMKPPEGIKEVEQEISEGFDMYQEKKEDVEKTRQNEVEKLKTVVFSQVQETTTVFEDEKIATIYAWYESAMRRGGKAPLGEDSFKYHFFEGGSTTKTYMYGSFDTGFLLGVVKKGIFIPTHNAPKGPFGGISLLKKLAKAEIPVLMAITKDLVDLVKNIPGWTVYPETFPSYFRGEYVEKYIVHNTHPLTKILEEKGVAFAENDSDSDTEIEKEERQLLPHEGDQKDIENQLEEQQNRQMGTQSMHDIIRKEFGWDMFKESELAS